MTSLHEHFNDFIETRLTAGNHAFTNNEEYSKALAFFDECPLVIHNQAMKLSSVGESIAYRLGFQDGYNLVAENKQ